MARSGAVHHSVLPERGCDASGGWFMGLIGLHDFFGWEAPSYFEGAAWMAAFAALLRWARP